MRTIDTLETFNKLLKERDLHGPIDMDFSLYLNCGLPGSSDLQLYNKGPAHYLAKMEGAGRSETPDMVTGRALHCRIIESKEDYQSRFVVEPRIDKRTKEGKAAYAKFLQETTGKTVLSRAQDATVESCVHWIDRQENVSLLKRGLSEVTVFAEFEGAWFRGRFDKYDPKLNYICDLKSTTYDTPDAFIRSVFKYGYHIQAAYYSMLAQMSMNVPDPAYYIVGLPKTAPHELMVFRLGDSAMALGREVARRLMYMHSRCLRENNWPFHDPEIMRLEAPDWALREEGMIE